MIALLEARRAGLLGRSHWLPNIVSGIVVGVVALPLAMAFAIASGAKPEQGLYTAIVAGLIVALFGGSRVQISGPTGAFIVILSGITAEYGIHGLQIATMMAGAMLLLFGLLRLGTVIRFIPAPVIVGFTSGIAVVIWVGQWQEFFGLPPVAASHFHLKVLGLVEALPHLHLPTTGLALLSLTLLVVSPRLPGLRKVPGPVVALLVVTVLQFVLGLEGVKTIGSAFGGIPQGLPEWVLPQTSLPEVIRLIGPAFTIALLGAIESLLSAVVADGMARTRHDSNQELTGQGLANLVAPLFGGFASTGALARTATNIRNGGTSPLSGVVHSLVLVVVLVALAPLASHIPLAVLAAILFVVAWNMSELDHFAKILRRAPPADVAILLVTFGLTVFADLVVAVNIGVTLAVLQFMRRMAASVEVRQSTAGELAQELGQEASEALPPGVQVFAVEGPFFFGAVENFQRSMANIHAEPQVLIVRLKWVPFIDMTGLQTLEQVIVDLQRRGVRVMLTGANPRVAAKLRRAQILELIGEDNSFTDFREALAAVVHQTCGPSSAAVQSPNAPAAP